MENEVLNFLNVTALEPRQKHPTIFKMFDALTAGESLVIHNDHDPKPLYYQLLGERGNIFTWEYLKSGPEIWEVKISKPADGKGETIGDIVAADYRKAQVFKKYGIDFCCKGNKSLKEVCAEKHIDAAVIERELNEQLSVTSRPLKYKEWPLDFLADYIVNTHHAYVRENLPVITELAEKVYNRHGKQHPELKGVADVFGRVASELASHMVKEERILFPYVKSLAAMETTAGRADSHFGSVRGPINMMEMEHEVVGNDMEHIRQLTGNYALPDGACASYTLLYKLLEEFEDDLHTHIHLENNILFPKALELENSRA